MKITIERAALLRVLGHAQSIVERRNTIPILSNVLLDADGDSLVVSATDLDLQVREKVASHVERKGRTTVAAHTFHDIVRKMPDGCEIKIDVENGRMALVAGRARFSLPVLEADAFPELNAGEMSTSFKMPAEELSRMINRAKFAMSTEETRYYLNGIFMHVVPGRDGTAQLRAAATDGHRLALVTTTVPETTGEIPDVIVHKKCVGEIAKVIDDVEGDIEISMSKTKIRFDMGGLVYISKVIDGTFPEYERVIPRDNSMMVVVDANKLAEGIDRVSTIATERTRAVKVSLEKDRIVLSVTSPEHGLATEEVEATYDGTPFEIGFNSAYFMDILRLLRGEQVEIMLKDSAAPTLFRKAGEPNDLAVLMPMRV